MTRIAIRPSAARFLAIGLALTTVFALVPRVTSAAPPAPAPPRAGAPGAPSASVGSTLSQIAARLAADIGAETKSAIVCAASLRSDEPAPRGAELAGKVASLLAGKLGSSMARVEPATLAAAQAAARRASWLVYVQAEVLHGQLRVTADVYRATRNVWERAREPVPAPTAHAYAAGRIDGEVRSYLAPLPLVGARIDRATVEDKEIVALACGDVDDDGALEIVTLSRRRIAIGRARAGRFVAMRSAFLRDFSGIAPTPLREPLGGVAIVPSRGGPPNLDVGISDRARGSRLDSELKLLGAINGVPFGTPYGDACMRFQGSTLATTVGKCADGDSANPPFDIDGPLDAAAAAIFVGADGIVRTIDAARDPRTGEVSLRALGRTMTLPRAGAQMALADLDQNGAPEVITTLDVLPKPPGDVDDALVITTLEADGSLRERSRIPVPTGIRAVAACPPEGGGSASVVIATPGELWIVR
ncbi:MAG TPA: hypothetical protein VK540_06355 [Polyangiaceae bacterium]|nr:hypothetical protein [Polyangiaceae bacterium]